LTLTFKRDQLGSESWKIVVIYNQSSTPAASFLSNSVGASGTGAIATAPTATSAASTSATAFNEIVVVFAGSKTKQVVVRSFLLRVKVSCSQLSLDCGNVILLYLFLQKSLLVYGLMLSCLSGYKRRASLGSLLV